MARRFSPTAGARLDADVIVAGGGPAGLAAAVAAARNGADTLLIERYGFLGGMATAGLVNPFMTYWAGRHQIIRGILQDLIDGLSAAGAYGHPRSHTAFDPEIFKFVADSLCQQAGVRLLLHSLVAEADVRGGGLQSVRVENKSGAQRLTARIYVDATGDADLAFRAGVPCEKGRPEDGLCQPMTLNFRLAGVAISRMPRHAHINRLFNAAKAAGEVHCPRENVLWFYTTRPGVIHFNTTRVTHRDATNAADLTAAELEARAQVQELVAFLRSRVRGFERAYLESMGAQIGVRESRRIVGQYVLTDEDVLSARKFPDGIARGSYPIDIHNPAGAGTVLRSLPPGEWYEIPYRCLLPRGADNLLVAGRPISSTHEAHSSLRVMPIAIAVGQAAGTAAALCAARKIAPAQLPAAALRRRLAAQDVDLSPKVKP